MLYLQPLCHLVAWVLLLLSSFSWVLFIQEFLKVVLSSVQDLFIFHKYYSIVIPDQLCVVDIFWVLIPLLCNSQHPPLFFIQPVMVFCLCNSTAFLACFFFSVYASLLASVFCLSNAFFATIGCFVHWTSSSPPLCLLLLCLSRCFPQDLLTK